MNNPEHLLTAAEAADRLGVSRMTVFRMVANTEKGKTPALAYAARLPGETGAYLFAPAEVERVKALRESAAA